MSEYKLDLNNYTNEPPKPITHEMFNKVIKQRDICLEDIKKLREREKKLEQLNENQLKLLKDFSKFINYKLEIHQSSFIYKNYRAKLDKLGVK